MHDFSSASDVYELLPHGQDFEEDIIIKFPLTSSKLYDANALEVMYSDTTSQQTSDWKPMEMTVTNEPMVSPVTNSDQPMADPVTDKDKPIESDDRRPLSREASSLFWDGECYINRRHFCEIFVKQNRSLIILFTLIEWVISLLNKHF